jgi:ABC-type sugar transport system permease subunit
VAQIEGATAYESFWKITIPMVSPLILTNVVYTIVDAFGQSTVVQLAYTEAFTNVNFGLSSAMSLISTAVALLFLGVVSFAISRYVYYQN